MSNINPIFSIEYPNLDTLLFIRKQYPQLADMEIGTSIIDEECILAHYLPSEDEACEVAEELIYFGTLLASTNHFHRTYDEHELLYRCVNLRHEAKPEQSTDEERVNQIEVKCDRNNVLTIIYPRDETVFSNVDFEARSTYFDLQTVVSNDILDVLKEAFGVKPETRLFVGRNNVSFHIFDFTRFCLGGKTTMEATISKINDVLLKPENRGKVEAKKVKAPEELLFVNLDNHEPVTLSKILANAVKHGKSTLGLKVFKGFKPNEVVPLQGGEHSTCTSKQFDAGVVGYIVKEVKSEKFKSLLGHVDVAYDPELDQLTITYPLDKTVLSTFNLSSTDIGGWLENITSISDSVRTIIKMEYDFEADVRMLGIKDKIKIYVDDISKVAEKSGKDIKEVIMNVVPKVNALVLKPQYQAKYAS